MNAAFNEDQGPSVKVAVTEIVQQYGAMRVIGVIAWQSLWRRRRQKAVSLPAGLSPHMLRDIGLPPDDG
jgi:uncharacterized protein YjiS (DUF1127 family)